VCRFPGSAEPPAEGDKLTELKYETLTLAFNPDNRRRRCGAWLSPRLPRPVWAAAKRGTLSA